MKLGFPSHEFDDAVAAACRGSVSDEQARALNELLRSDPAARDEYILRVELHSRLATQSDLFVPRLTPEPTAERALAFPGSKRLVTRRTVVWALGLAACLALLAVAGRRGQPANPVAPVATPVATPVMAVS